MSNHVDVEVRIFIFSDLNRKAVRCSFLKSTFNLGKSILVTNQVGGLMYCRTILDVVIVYSYSNIQSHSGNAWYHSVKNLLSSCLLVKTIKIRKYKTVILPVVLYGCETLSLTLKEEHGLTVFERRVVRRLFGPNRDEVTLSWRKLHNGEVHNLNSSTSIVRMVKSRRER
jgi:hypothetical protein